ncbi:Gfo/Idh/MocA family protein [Verrucomicrobiota bacterium sgz303538]
MTRRQFLATAASASLAASATPFVSAQEKKWRVGIIGHTGRGDYGHGLHTMWQAIPETEVVGIADPDPKGLEKARQKLNGVRGFSSYGEMLAELKPEIVAICPRHIDQHRDIALAAIRGGTRGIYMEKPFCRTPAEADEIVAACQGSGVKLAIAHRNRYHPALQMVQQALKEGAIGQLLELRGRGKEDMRGGGLDMWVLGSHVFNLMHHLAGKPLTCSAELLVDGRPATQADVQEGAEGVGPLAGNRLHARFEMEAGVPAYFDSIRSAGVSEANFGLQLIGNKGIIDLRIDTEPLAHFVPGNPHRPTAEPRPWIPITSAGIEKPEPISEIKPLVANHTLAGRDLLAAIKENRAPLCSAEDGRVTVEMISAVFASHVRGGARVKIPLQNRGNPLANWA